MVKKVPEKIVSDSDGLISVNTDDLTTDDSEASTTSLMSEEIENQVESYAYEVPEEPEEPYTENVVSQSTENLISEGSDDLVSGGAEDKIENYGNYSVITIFGRSFWDLWFQKIFRNMASIKFQMLLLIYVPIIYGMFEGKWVNNAWTSKIPATIGLGFLGGGYVTLALGRIYAKTRLKETDVVLDTDS